ncbi:AraC family transcriptional regulator [Nocardioides marmorisolisilvae]|uniref:AraC family transcriptional regulator n=1 Tax=Nocardioides marmorisolisilvae TaxID=1542737 RepID=A0A3N0E0P9_9ACTN|nr:AraC family transcriptional regulator [Nocardioides marmorisolisilvae]RNL81390.1 AraC family transcriptional regulator [Nocardioides marmorisolisilvae]
MRLDDFTRPAVPVGYGQLILDVAATHGVEPAALLAASDVPPELMQDPNGRISAMQSGLLLLNAMEMSAEPALGYEIGLHSSLTSHGLMGYGLISSPTVRDAIGLSERYMPARLPMLTMTLAVDGPVAAIEVVDNAPLGPVRQCTIDLYLVGVARIAPILTDRVRRSEELELWFDYPEPEYYARFADRLPSARFEMGVNQVRFPAADLDLTPETANHVTVAMIEDQCRRELEQLGLGGDLVTQVLAALRESPGGVPDLDTIAERLRMSSRTFKRRLQEHGTSFRQLVESARKAEAVRLLSATSLSVAQVADNLGYADASSFSRAFQKWTSTTPGAFRRGTPEVR